jgi:hypothetical protein
MLIRQASDDVTFKCSSKVMNRMQVNGFELVYSLKAGAGHDHPAPNRFCKLKPLFATGTLYLRRYCTGNGNVR